MARARGSRGFEDRAPARQGVEWDRAASCRKPGADASGCRSCPGPEMAAEARGPAPSGRPEKKLSNFRGLWFSQGCEHRGVTRWPGVKSRARSVGARGCARQVIRCRKSGSSSLPLCRLHRAAAGLNHRLAGGRDGDLPSRPERLSVAPPSKEFPPYRTAPGCLHRRRNDATWQTADHQPVMLARGTQGRRDRQPIGKDLRGRRSARRSLPSDPIRGMPASRSCAASGIS